ncbi:c6 zinc finger domain-containing protein [Stemphylium lycopersici]|nr:c6 zinc finger domain-containing protein [Stemphylium lycopersici]
MTTWATNTGEGPAFATPNNTDINHSAFELDSLRARINELEDKLSRATSTASSASPTAAPPTSTQTVQTFREMIEAIEPHLRSGSSNLITNMQRAKILARSIKAQRSPAWPTPPTKDLPPRSICDQLIAGYLRTMERIYRVLHVPSFQSTYESIWVNDAEPNTGFLIMLKLVLAIGTTLHDDSISMRADAIRWVYEAQTWLSSPTFKSQLGIPYLQTSILLLLARELVDVGSELVWISVGAVYRTAVYIGLHKDPSQLPQMTLLEAEMRRRIWNTILELSLQMSMLSGGPPCVSLGAFDTSPPGNFDDEQLLKTDAIARPDNVFTSSSVAIVLRKTLSIRLTILEFLNGLSSNGTYEETLRIDSLLRAAYKILRRTLQAFTIGAFSLPSPFALQAIEFIMQRYITCLHLPFFASALNDPMYAYSRKATIESSLKIWGLACAASSNGLFPADDTDVSRMSRCTAGFFRAYAFHAATFLAAEWRMRLQDEQDDVDLMSGSLSSVVEDASSWYLRCIQAGETGVKGYLLLRLLEAWIDGTKRQVSKADLPVLLVKASEQAVDICMPILEAAAGAKGQSTSPFEEGRSGIGSFDFEFLSEPMEDWDMLIAETFDLGDVESFGGFML